VSVLHVAACLWDANKKTHASSRCYTDDWVSKLYRGFERNLTVEFQFDLFTDRIRPFGAEIHQHLLAAKNPDWSCLIEPFKLNEPTIICGLDTLIVRNIDEFASYCLTGDRIALPRDPYKPERSINGIAFVPAGYRRVYDEWRGENDMTWLREARWDTVFIDDLWPGQVLSLKAHCVRSRGLQGARVIYMHGRPKQHELLDFGFVREHWR
jgi:hypothetical protein